MTHIRSGLLLATALAASSFASLIQADEETTGRLYIMPQTVTLSSASSALSQDGFTVVAQYIGDQDHHGGPVVWSREAGLVSLGEAIQGGSANSVSLDGSTVTGRLGVNPFVWTKGGDTEIILKDGQKFIGEGEAISADGAVIAGSRNDGNGNRIPFVSTFEDDIIDLVLPEGYVSGHVNVVSADGNVYAGFVQTQDAHSVPAIWIGVENVRLLDVPQGANTGQVIDMLPDGSAVLVNAFGSINAINYIFDLEEEITITLPEKANPFAMNIDEDDFDEHLIVVGNKYEFIPGKGATTYAYAWIYNEEGELVEAQDLNVELQEILNLDPEEGWLFHNISSISANGNVAIGQGNKGGFPFSFVLDADGELGIEYVTFPSGGQGQGQRFAALIENAQDVGEMWVLSDWLGYLWTGIYQEQEWVYHLTLDWVYVPALPELEVGYWFYATSLEQWIYTEEEIFPWIYQSADGEWVYFN